MQIRDLEYKTGLDRATIRYYEKEGLISPERHDNGYREYSQAHLSLLLKIKLLRQLGFSLEIIKELQNGTGDFDAFLKNQIELLESKMRKIERSISVCMQIRNDKATFSTLDASYYLDLLAKLEDKSTNESFSEDVPQPFHPWRRFFARMVDYAWIDLLLSILFSLILRIRPFVNSLGAVLLSFVAMLVAIPVLAAMIHLWGTTPGKWLFGLSIVSENGNKLDFSAAKDREVEVFIRGCGMGLPVFNIVRLIMSYTFYRNEVPDLDENVEYRYHDFTQSKVIFAVLVIIALNISNSLIIADAYQPRFKGDLSVKEFSKNYNFYAKILDKNSNRMEIDGTFEGMQGVVIHMGGEPENANLNFTYDTYDGSIQAINYRNSWFDCMLVTPIGLQCETAVITAVMSQKGTNVIDLFQIIKVLSNVDKCSNEQFCYKNVTVFWVIDAKNLQAVNGQFLMAEGDTAGLDNDACVSIDFSIIIDNTIE